MIKTRITVAFLITAAMMHGRNVLVLPNGAARQPVAVFKGDSLTAAGTFVASSSAFTAFSNPAGAKYYVVGREATETLVVVDGTFSNRLKSFDVAGGARAAAITPDGRRILILGSGLHIFDTAEDREIAVGVPQDLGEDPGELSVSQDSRRAYVLSIASRRLTVIDLATNTVAGSLPILGTTTGVTVGPNDLVYVSAQNRIYEIDGRAVALRGEIPLNELPGKVGFTPDGRGVVSNRTTLTGSVFALFNPTNRTVGRLPSFFLPGVTLDRMHSAGNNRVFAVTGGSIYEITLNPVTAALSSFTSIGGQGAVNDLAFSNEISTLPNGTVSRYLYIAQGRSLNRIDLSLNQLSGAAQLGYEGARLAYAGPVSTNPVAGFLTYNVKQTVSPGGTSIPLVVRLYDSDGQPVYNAPVVYTASAAGVTIQTPSATTNADGFAQTVLTVPAAPGSFTVTAGFGTGLTTRFTVNIGNPAQGTPSVIEVVSGNGQLAGAGSGAPEALRVAVRDAFENPIPGAEVRWSMIGPGRLSAESVLTDANGQAAVTFAAPENINPLFFIAGSVKATVAGISADLYVTTFFVSNVLPNITIVTPNNNPRGITGVAGQTLTGALQVRVTSPLGQAMPNVSLRAGAATDATSQLSAGCANENGTALTDSTGLASCDLKLGGLIGNSTLNAAVGNVFPVAPVGLTVTAGAPTLIRIQRGNQQSGQTGQTLASALLATVTDEFGNVLPGTQVQWEVVTPNSITLTQVVSTANSQGQVSALPTLGPFAGTYQVKVSTGGVSAVFSLTVTTTSAQMTKVSGDNQTASQNQPFLQPLRVRVIDGTGRSVPGVPVAFVVSTGRATLESTSGTTDADGNASTTVRAGDASGTVTIAAFAQNLSTAFTLTVRVRGPVIVASGIVNAASLQPGVTPGAIVTIRGTDIATGIDGTVSTNPGSPLPTILAGVTVRFGFIFAPILSISNVNGQESITVQAPFELQPGVTPVTIDVSGFSTTVSTAVLPYQPGVFETVASDGKRYATLFRSDGTAVTPGNPARRGETLRLHATGLGQVSPSTGTNRPGVPGQRVIAQLIVGVNDEGVVLVNAEYAPRNIGLYYVDFQVPEQTASGAEIHLALALVQPDGSAIFANTARIPIE